MSAVATTPSQLEPLPTTKKNYLTALKEALFDEMERNPQMICQGESVVTSSNSRLSRSRSLVTLPAENTGPTSTLNRIT